jgi:hypothetical protein
MSDIGITSIGHRLAILKAIYQLKMDMTRAASGPAGYGDEGLDDGHLDGEGEDGQFDGWEWTEDDWRPAGRFSHFIPITGMLIFGSLSRRRPPISNPRPLKRNRNIPHPLPYITCIRPIPSPPGPI